MQDRSSFMDAVEAMEKAQQEFSSGKASQRILLVYDEDVQMVGRHDSLFVKDGERIVGLIRFSDVYRKIAQTMRECPLPA